MRELSAYFLEHLAEKQRGGLGVGSDSKRWRMLRSSVVYDRPVLLVETIKAQRVASIRPVELNRRCPTAGYA